MYSTDITYPDKRSARGKFTQLGMHSALTFARRLPNVRLRLYESLARQDLTIRTALNTYINYIISTIGQITHPDPEIASFLNNNILKMEDTLGVSWKNCLTTAKFTECWAGASVSELLFKLDFGTLSLSDIVTYHPSTINIYTDKRGRLVENAETWDSYRRSGIYQTVAGSTVAEKQLQFWKILYLSNQSHFGNFYGQSLVAPSYKWERLKNAIIDLMVLHLEKAGHRLTWIASTSSPTSQVRVNPSTGEEEPITTFDLLKEQIDSDEGIKTTLMLPFNIDGAKPEVGSIPQSDMVANTFLDSIWYADQESIRHIIPYFLVSDRSLGLNPDSIERRMEVFYNSVELARDHLASALIKQVFTLLVRWNFNRASANIPPSFTRVYSDRSEDRVATMQMVKGLTELGYLNPTNDNDWNIVRQMVRLSSRRLESSDRKFIDSIVLEPRRKTTPSDVGPNGSGKPGRSTGSTTKQIKARDK